MTGGNEKTFDVEVLLWYGAVYCGGCLASGELVGFIDGQVFYYLWVDKGVCGLVINYGQSCNGFV